MRAISAVDSVSLAIQRTREFLFRQFTWGTYLKLSLVAIVTEGLGSSFQSSTHHGTPSGHVPMTHSPFGFTPGWPGSGWPAPGLLAAIVAAILLAVILGFWIFYLVTRLRFAYFHCLIHNTKLIRPGWRLYSAQALRFFWLNIVVGFCFMLVVGLIALPFIAGFLKLVHESQQGSQLDIPLLLSLLLPLIPIFILLALAGFAADMILRDWILPHYALEDATAGEAWSSVWARIKAEKRQFFVYALLRVALPIIATVALFILLMIPGLILAGSVAVVEFGIHSTFADATGSPAVVGVLLEVFFGLIAFGFAVLAGICLGGPLSTGIREYALIFYGGRYQVLGEILYPPMPPGIPRGPYGVA